MQYELNKEYITRTFCENKDKPKMHCNGKCHMAKMLKQEEKNNNLPAGNLLEKWEVQWYSESNSQPEITYICIQTITAYHYNRAVSGSILRGVFHPPSV